VNSFVRSVVDANINIYHALNKDDNTLVLMGDIGVGGDISSGADMLAESIFVSHLSKYGTIESEESGTIGNGESNIIIDPLDGSSNYLSNFPYYGTSVAIMDDDKQIRAAVVCNLANGDIFIKERNSGIRFENFLDKDKSFHKETNPQIGLFEKAYAHPNLVAELSKKGYKFRSPGATALSLAYAKDAAFFIFAGKTRVYDFAAGLALCEGMEMTIEDEYVIVTKEKKILNDLNEIVNRSIK